MDFFAKRAISIIICASLIYNSFTINLLGKFYIVPTSPKSVILFFAFLQKLKESLLPRNSSKKYAFYDDVIEVMQIFWQAL